MWIRGKNQIRRIRRFFRIMLGYMDLAEYYKINWRLSYSFGVSLSDIESMQPYERDIYIDMTAKDVEKKMKKAEEKRRKSGR